MDPNHVKESSPEESIKMDPRDSDIEASLDTPIEKTPTQVAMDYPDGGLRAWSVAVGAAGVLFCTFGYANAFGYDLFYSPSSLKY